MCQYGNGVDEKQYFLIQQHDDDDASAQGWLIAQKFRCCWSRDSRECHFAHTQHRGLARLLLHRTLRDGRRAAAGVVVVVVVVVMGQTEAEGE